MIPAKKAPARAAIAAVVLGMLAACANDRGPHPDLPPLGVRVDFFSQNLCEQGVSPEIRLGGVPANAASYRLRLTNVSVLNARPREMTAKADGAVIPEGTFSDFEAPCIGELQTSEFRLEVMALANDGRPLAYGWGFATARSLTRQLDAENAQARGRLPAPDRTSPIPVTRPVFFIH
jgi:hypothetical protein